MYVLLVLSIMTRLLLLTYISFHLQQYSTTGLWQIIKRYWYARPSLLTDVERHKSSIHYNIYSSELTHYILCIVTRYLSLTWMKRNYLHVCLFSTPTTLFRTYLKTTRAAYFYIFYNQWSAESDSLRFRTFIYWMAKKSCLLYVVHIHGSWDPVISI